MMRTMKLPVPTKGVEDVDAFVAERASEFLLQNLFDAAHHEIDDGLLCIDDAVGIGLFGRVALEESLVDLIEKGLFFRKARGFFSATLNGAVEAFVVAQKGVAVQGPLCQLGNDLFNFSSD